MRKEIALLQDLIDALDDTTAFYAGAVPRVTRLCVRNLLTWRQGRSEKWTRTYCSTCWS